jgi:hypothetical protein
MKQRDARDATTVGQAEPGHRLRVLLLEMVALVATAAVSFRWPGLCLPASLLFLYALARRRDLLPRTMRVALGQVALALYLRPPWPPQAPAWSSARIPATT